MPRGGARAGAGRKSNAELALCRSLIDKAVSNKDWISIFKRMAASDDGRVLATLIHQRFGLPSQLIGGDPDAEPILIRTIEANAIGISRTKRKRTKTKPALRSMASVAE